MEILFLKFELGLWVLISFKTWILVLEFLCCAVEADALCRADSRASVTYQMSK
jgi:hypothetical protein